MANIYAKRDSQWNIKEYAKYYEHQLSKEWNNIPWNKIEKNLFKLQKHIASAEIKQDYKKARKLQQTILNNDSIKLYAIREVKKLLEKQGKKNKILTENQGMMLFFHMTNKKSNIKYGQKFLDIIPLVNNLIVYYALKPRLLNEYCNINYNIHDCNNLLNGKLPWIIKSKIKVYNSYSTYISEQIGDFPARIEENYSQSDYLDKKLPSFKKNISDKFVISKMLENIVVSHVSKSIFRKIQEKNEKPFKYEILVHNSEVYIFTKTKSNAREILDILNSSFEYDILRIEDNIKHLSSTLNVFGFDIKLNSNKNKSRLMINASKESVKLVKNKIKILFRKYRSNHLELLITKLNRLMWKITKYFKIVTSRKVFHDFDYYISQLVHKYLKRQHSNKSLKWIKRKYFRKSNYPNKEYVNVLTSPNDSKIQLKHMVWLVR